MQLLHPVRSTPARDTASPTIGVQAVHPLLACLSQRGVDVSPLFHELGLDPAVAADPDGRIPLTQLDHLWERAAHITRDPNIGLHAAETVTAGSFGIVSYLGLNSPTFGQALARVQRYFRLLSDASAYHLTEVDGVATLVATQDVPPLGPVRQRVEFTIAVVSCYAADYIDGGFVADEVFLEHPQPDDVRQHARIFKCPVRFGAPTSGLTFPAATLARVMRGGDGRLVEYLERLAAQMLAEIPQDKSVAQALREQLLRDGANGNVSLPGVARQMGMSVRTLQRRLRSEGTSHQKVIDEIRWLVARRMLANRAIGVAEVAFTLGFSDAAAFHRAFKRWTGQTPMEYRRLGREGP